MKNLSGLVLLAFLLTIPAIFATYPVKNPNPWPDNYLHITSIENYKKWGTYNVHDPAVIKSGDAWYMYSTDAVYYQQRGKGRNPDVKAGNIHVRSSKDLVNWQFEGWAFDSIPSDDKKWVLDHSDNKGASNIWAPYPVFYKDKYRLYYCVSAFGLQTSSIGLAESDTPLGPWILKGAVVRTQKGDRMNAIDPSIVTNPVDGRMWMHYGSYFGGLYVVELNPETGLTLHPNDQGHFVATRVNIRKDNIEAPEIIYHPGLKQYFLFTSYDPLMTTYHVRVGRSEKPEGPFLDYFGRDMRDTVNHLPVLTHPYRFKNHQGWAGTGHCAVFDDGKGKWFMAHQGRLSPENLQMVLHVREICWTQSGWPVVSPQRYAGEIKGEIKKKELIGEWEIIRIQDAKTDRKLEFGQILWGEGQLRKTEINLAQSIIFNQKGQIISKENQELKDEPLKNHGKWIYRKDRLSLKLNNETISELNVFLGQDWENETITILFTGLDSKGFSVWGKKTAEMWKQKL